MCNMFTPLLPVANTWCFSVAISEAYTVLDVLVASLWGRLYCSSIAHSFTHFHVVSPLYNLLKVFRAAWVEIL